MAGTKKRVQETLKKMSQRLCRSSWGERKKQRNTDSEPEKMRNKIRQRDCQGVC